MQVWLSVGSNLQRNRNISSAIAVLRAEFGELILSPVYQNQAVGFAGTDFYNLVIGFHTAQPASVLSGILKGIEGQHGRQLGEPKFSPRTLDLDLLTYGNQVLDTDDLQIPRDEILKYAFVLGPLADVAPEDRHPLTGESYAELWAAFPIAGQQSLHRVELATQ